MSDCQYLFSYFIDHVNFGGNLFSAQFCLQWWSWPKTLSGERLIKLFKKVYFFKIETLYSMTVDNSTSKTIAGCLKRPGQLGQEKLEIT
jgi:hypothetical protein